MKDLDALLRLMTEAAVAAGAAAMAYFREGGETAARVSYKTGNSPVSEADHAADAVLERALRAACPDCGWISEETADTDARLSARRVFIVDPIDGTRAFIAGDARWCVSVGLAEEGVPVAGVIHAPALGLTYAAAQGRGASLNGVPIRCPSAPASPASVHAAGPRPLLDRLEAASAAGIVRAARTPSLALRLAQAADGTFDLAVASEGAHDWDIAAADILLREAGGLLLDQAGLQLVYNAVNLRRGVLAAGAPYRARDAVRALGLRS